MFCSVVGPVQGTEPPGVPVAKGLAGSEAEIKVIMHAGGSFRVDDIDAARHAEVHDGRAVRRIEKQVLRPSPDRCHRCAEQIAVDVRADRPAQAAVADDDVFNAFTDEVGRYAAAAGLDFGEFGHGSSVHARKEKPA